MPVLCIYIPECPSDPGFQPILTDKDCTDYIKQNNISEPCKNSENIKEHCAQHCGFCGKGQQKKKNLFYSCSMNKIYNSVRYFVFIIFFYISCTENNTMSTTTPASNTSSTSDMGLTPATPTNDVTISKSSKICCHFDIMIFLIPQHY